jgi:DNA-binding transcriptional LysR family regulator
MDLNETLAFVVVARTGSFTSAGKRLALPKATVSRRVARLEERLRVRLLERTTRSVALTAAGRAYYERCEHGIEEIENAERAALDVSGNATGTLRISAPFDLARDRLASLLPELRRKHPHLALVVELTQRRVDLIAEGFDVALRGGPRLDDNSLIARKIIGSEIILCAAPRYLAKRGTPATAAALADHQVLVAGPLVSSPSSSAPNARRIRLHAATGPVELALTPWLVANEFGFLREAAIAGAGIATVESSSVTADLRAKRLRRVLPALSIGGGALWAVYPSSHHLSPKVRVFIDFLVSRLGGGAGGNLTGVEEPVRNRSEAQQLG